MPLLRIALAGVAALAVVLGGCGDDPPTEPARTADNTPMIEVRDSAAAIPSLMVDNDSTNEECNDDHACVIQDQTYHDEFRVHCPAGEGECGTGTYGWELLNPPPGTTITFNPSTTDMEQWTTLSIETDSATPTGVTQSEVNSIPLNGSPVASGELELPVHVVCSFHFENCPVIEIRDSAQSGAPVVSAPTGTQTTLIGRRMHLAVKHKQGSGSGSYALDDVQWTLDGMNADAIIKSYDITAPQPEVDNLSSVDLRQTKLLYYYVIVNDGYKVNVEATLEGDDVSHTATATATYDVGGPTNVSMTSTTIAAGVAVGEVAGDTSERWLRFGNAIDTAGIEFVFTATALPGDDGYVAGTQLVNVDVDSDPPANWPTTAGRYWLDQCRLYDSSQPAVGQTYRWESRDSPGVFLDPVFSEVEVDAQFEMYFMYRPSGSTSIWVPLGQMDWFYEGTATKTGSPTNGNHGWELDDGDASVHPTGAPSSEFPEWSQALDTLPTASCPSIPTN